MRDKPPKIETDRPALGFVESGGAHLAAALTLATNQALKERGIDTSSAHHLGTSGGAIGAGMIHTGLSIEDITQIPEVNIPSFEALRPNYVLDCTREMFGDVRAENIRTTSVKVIGRLAGKLVILGDEDASLAERSAASSSPPGLTRPTIINGTRYIDGATPSLSKIYLSNTHADRAIDTENLIVIDSVQLPSPKRGPKRAASTYLSAISDMEMRRWRENYEGQTAIIRPNQAISELYGSPFDLFKLQKAQEAYRHGLEMIHQQIDDPKTRLSQIVGSLAVSNLNPPTPTHKQAA